MKPLSVSMNVDSGEKTWLTFPDEQTLWFQVAELCEKHIQEEQAARRKDGA